MDFLISDKIHKFSFIFFLGSCTSVVSTQSWFVGAHGTVGY